MTRIGTAACSSRVLAGAMLVAFVSIGACQAEPPAPPAKGSAMTSHSENIGMWMNVKNQRFAVTLAPSNTARQFVARLPLSLEMEELNGNEKFADLANPLPTVATRPGTIHAGDVMLYGTRTLVVFYDTFQSNYAYTRVGRVDDPAGLRSALGPSGARVSFLAAEAVISPQPGVQTMHIDRKGSLPSVPGPAEYFTGQVHIDMQFQRTGDSRIAGAIVSFEPGARTAWHTHPLGQNLFVTSGKGWTQCEGEPIVEINAGDIIWCPPGHKHWHGATPNSPMTHIAVQEALDGKVVTWMEQVSDEQYLAGIGNKGD